MSGYAYEGNGYIGAEYGQYIGGEVNIIVSDSAYDNFGELFYSTYNLLAESLNAYVEELKLASETLIESGETHRAFEDFIDIFSGSVVKITEIGYQHKILCKAFIQSVDSIDKDVYEPGCDPRDYTSDTMNSYARAVRDTKGWVVFSFLDNFINNVIENLKYKLFSFGKGAPGYENETIVRKSILEKLDYAEDDIKKIHKLIIQEDSTYAQRFATLYDEFESVLSVIKEAKDIVCGKKEFTFSNIKNIRNKLDVIKITDHSYLIKTHISINDGNADSFCAEKDNLSFFDDYSTMMDEARARFGIADVLIASATNATASAYAEYFKSYKVPDGVSGVEVYDYLIIKEKLASTIEDISKNKYDSSDYTKEIEKLNEYLNKFKDTNSEPGNENDFYGALISAAEKQIAMCDLTVDVMEIVLPIMYCYEENLKVIRSLKAGMDPDSLTAKAVEQLAFEYENKVLLSLDKLLEKTIDEMAKSGVKKFNNMVLDMMGGQYGTALFAAEQIAELSGITEIGEDTYEFNCLCQQNDELISAYKHNFEVVASGDYTSQDVDNLNNSFEILKSYFGEEFDMLSRIAGNKGEHDMKNYYAFMSDRIKNSTATTLNSSMAVSYEEYLAM